jgi:hypothetical protein
MISRDGGEVMAQRTTSQVFERRTLTIAVVPIVETVRAGDPVGDCDCSYCSGGCTNCTTSCKGAATTKHLLYVDPLEEVELDKKEILKAVTAIVEEGIR